MFLSMIVSKETIELRALYWRGEMKLDEGFEIRPAEVYWLPAYTSWTIYRDKPPTSTKG